MKFNKYVAIGWMVGYFGAGWFYPAPRIFILILIDLIVGISGAIFLGILFRNIFNRQKETEFDKFVKYLNFFVSREEQHCCIRCGKDLREQIMHNKIHIHLCPDCRLARLHAQQRLVLMKDGNSWIKFRGLI